MLKNILKYYLNTLRYNRTQILKKVVFMKNTLQTLLLASTLASTSLLATDNTKSLVGFEGGISQVNVEYSTAPLVSEKYDLVSGGVKIGAESENLRIFLNANYLDGDEFDYARTYGVAFQYLFNVADFMNIYAGVNSGIMDLRLLNAAGGAVDLRKSYIGADAGFNIHLGKSVDLEFGGRYLNIDADTTVSGVNYNFKDYVAAYGSLIFKFELER
jgi:hypothetical protein